MARNMDAAVESGRWTPDSWQRLPALQQPAYRDGDRLARVLGELARLPPIVVSWEIDQLKAGAQIFVGTPGRLIDLNNQRLLDLSHATEVVLDEADKMLDLGFLPDIEKIFSKVGTAASYRAPGQNSKLSDAAVRSETNRRIGVMPRPHA